MTKRAKQKKTKQGTKKLTAKAKLSAKRKSTKHKKTRTTGSRPASRRQVAVQQAQPKRLARAAVSGAGDFTGVPRVESADSESQDELLEEGQTFEAGIVAGVENALEPDQGEVRTREVPEDDVPEEYDDGDNS